MQFLYYVKKKDHETLDGLLYAFESKPLERATAKGPEGNEKGFIIFDAKAAANMAAAVYAPDVQTWRKIPGQEVWVGCYTDQGRPSPEDLLRQETLPGHKVKLDSHQWEIPCCRLFDGESFNSALPQVMELGEDGRWNMGSVVEKHRKLWDASSEWFDVVAQLSGEDIEPDMTVADVADACVLALATNYRLSAVEVSILGLLTSASRSEIMNATIDLPAIEEWSKKIESGPVED